MASTSAGLPEEKKERRGIGKMFSKAKGLLRRGDESGSSSTKRRSAAVPAASRIQPILKPSPEKTAAERAAEARARYDQLPGVVSHSRAQLLEERAKKLGERFGLDINTSQWQAVTPDATVLRMDKPIRMRVRRTCHQCNTTFTSAKECPQCQHLRCSQCARHPVKRTEEERMASREKRAALIKSNKENAPIVADWSHDHANNPTLKRPNKKGGQDLIHKKARQRVRRNCHECSALFVSGNKECTGCGHKRCTDCPRDPPKKDKYPFGYPGDEFGPKSIPHYECEQCKTVYPTGSEHGTECKTCGQPKTDESLRAKPRKVEPEPSPEVVRKIQKRMTDLKV